MTHREWRHCRDPLTMIRALKGKASDRKGRLYLCGGCRVIWDLLYSPYSRRAVDVVERFVDGYVSPSSEHYAHFMAEIPTWGFDSEIEAWRKRPPGEPDGIGVQQLLELGLVTPQQLHDDDPQFDREIQGRYCAAASLVEAATYENPFDQEHWQTDLSIVPWPGDWLLRCVFGNPYRPFEFFSPGWRTPELVDFARSIYEVRAFELMPRLGAALKEVGCTNQDMLDHCRSESPHVLGCWVLDLILGKT